MRKVIVLNRISIDGFFASLNDMTFGMDWFVQDPEVDQAVHEGNYSDTLLLGDITYKGFERSWVPMLNDPNTPPQMKAVAEELTKMTKVVFSTKLKQNDIRWANTELRRGNLAEVVKELKSREGADILIMGSGTIVQQLTNEGLIDEYLFIVTPVIAGEGKSLFNDAKQTNLKLVEAKSFKSGNVVLHYAVSL